MQYTHQHDAIISCAVEDQVTSRCKIAQAVAKIGTRRSHEGIKGKQIQCILNSGKHPVRSVWIVLSDVAPYIEQVVFSLARTKNGRQTSPRLGGGSVVQSSAVGPHF